MKRKVCQIVLSFLLILTGQIIFFPISAQENEEINQDVIEATEISVRNEEMPNVTIKYADQIQCGVPTPFSIEVSGDGSEYQYRLSVGRIDSGYELVVDPSKVSYGSSNVIEFTFVASGKYKLDFNVLYKRSDGKYGYTTNTVILNIEDPNYPSIDQLANNLVAQCEREGNTTEYEKALWFHDWLIKNCSYDHSYLYCGADSAFARGIGTCEAFYEAYVVLLNKVGIQTARITGNGHVWAAAKIDGKWTHIDPTWDADQKEGSFNQHMYFGLPDELIQIAHNEHVIKEEYKADSYDNNYFIHSGKIKEWSDPFVDKIQQKLNDGVTDFLLPIENSSILSAYWPIMYRLVAYDLSQKTWKVNNKTAQLSVRYMDNGNLHFKVDLPDYTLRLKVPSKFSDEIWIDGVKVNSVLENGQKVIELENGNAKVAVAYSYNGNNVPIGMIVWELTFQNNKYNVKELKGLENLLSYHGFSIRIKDPAGIRFKSGIDVALKKALVSTGVEGYKLVELGTISVSQAKMDAGNPLTIDKSYVRKGRAYWIENGKINDKVFETVDGRDRFTSVLVGIPASGYNTYLVFRSYAILSNGTSTITIYGPLVSRSIYHVAKQVKATGSFEKGSSGYKFIENIITTVEKK